MSAIATTVKAKFAGFLRNWLRRFDESEAARQPLIPTAAVGKTLTMPPPVMPPSAVRPAIRPAVRPQAKPVPPSAQPTQPNSTPPVRPSGPNELQLSLQPILDSLPIELRARIKRTDTSRLMVTLPLEKILTQLALGTVRITFGELRLAAPGVFADAASLHDQKPVALPLNEILTRLSPSLLSRRIVQKPVEVGEDIASPFGDQGQGLKISKPSARPAAPAAGIPKARMITPTPAVAETMQAPFPKRSITPSVDVSNGSHGTNGGNGSNGGSASRNFAPVETPQMPVTPISPITPILPDAPAIKIPIPEQPALFVPLSVLLTDWPEALKLEIVQVDLSNAQVALPLDVVEAALKRGRVVFSWRNLRALIKPAPPAVSAHDAVELTLPLHVIAPLFFERQNGAAAKSPQKIASAEEIPDLFFGAPTPQPAAPIAPVPVVPIAAAPIPLVAPIPAPPVVPIPPIAGPPAAAPVAPVAQFPDTNFFQRSNAPRITDTDFKLKRSPGTDFLSRGATPKEIVERAVSLEGVAGAIVALPDGLKVADKVPPELNADTLAGFLPQLFGRVTQCSKELRMGELNNLNFTVGNVPWKIFRVNAVYFAAFGRAGQALPTAQLAMLAAELDRKRI